VKEPKTEGSSATVAVPDLLVTELRVHKARQAQERMASSRWDIAELVFTTPVGSYLDSRNLLREWKDLCAAAGIERSVRIHDLRHTAASFLLSQKVPMRVVMETLRHTRLATTADLYTHVSQELKREAAEAMDELVRGLRGPSSAVG
jgi:integrase